MASPVVDLLSFALEKTTKSIAERWVFLDAEQLDEELPPTPWVCEGIGLAPGAVTIVGGAGFGGKTISMQSLLLAVATGRPAWNQFPVRQGKVKHLDFEQGRTLTQRRYQRLARAMGISLKDLKDVLSAACLPDARLSDDVAQRELEMILEGVTLAIVDAFRGAFPKANENESGARTYLDMLQKVSERTGCAIIVIMHSRKLEASDDADPRSSLRGSSALFDAAQGVLMLDGKKGKPTRVNHEKERIEGELKPTFGLAIKDVLDPRGDGDRKWGLAVEYLAPCEVQEAYMPDVADDNRVALNVERIATLGARMMPLIANATPYGGITAQMLRESFMPTSLSTIKVALDELCRDGAVQSDGNRASNALYTMVGDVSREPGQEG